MTAESKHSRVSYAGTGAVAPLAVPFRFLDDADIRATVQFADSALPPVAWRLGVDYTLAGARAAGGATLTPTAPIPVGATLLIERGERNAAVAPVSATSSLANPVSDPFLQAGAGAVPRTYQDKVREIVSVKDFGAIGDGVADDTSAFANAFAAHKCISVPAGNYRITGPIGSLSNSVGTSLYGHSNGLTVITLVGNSAGFMFSGFGWEVAGIRFVAHGVVACCIQTGEVSDNHSASIVDCDFVAESAGSYFEKVVEMNRCWNFSIRGCYFRNTTLGAEPCNGYAIVANYSVNVRVVDCSFMNYDRAVFLTGTPRPGQNDFCEGWLFSANTFIRNITHFYAEAGTLLPVFSANVIDVTQGGFPIFSKASCTTLIGNWISGRMPVKLQDSSRNIVSNNTFSGPGNPIDGIALNGTNVSLTQVIGNTFLSYGQAISADGNSFDWCITHNVFANQSVRCYDLSGLGGRSSVIDNTEYASSPGLAAGSVYAPGRHLRQSVVKQLVGGQPQESISFEIPAGLFLSKATVSLASSTAAADILCFYDYESPASTPTRAQYLLRTRNGLALPSGPVRFSVVHYE
ncbi:glycosyl hydrolase family 28-related protein [Lysobacter sp. Hz 25]|uniref:glycosyl hydrolase family 28-related protein n=1 Tax=Lysobacter sp. Hz 25 TaxID=3383698 RepID=UPI0038D47E48